MENTVKFYLSLPVFQICNCSPTCFWRLNISYCSCILFGKVFVIQHYSTLLPSFEHTAYLVWQTGGNSQLSARMISENVCRGQLQTWIRWLLSADCAPPAWATEDSVRLVPGWRRADTCSATGCGREGWAAVSRTVSGPGEGDAVALAPCVAEDSSELWECLPPSAGTASGTSEPLGFST